MAKRRELSSFEAQAAENLRKIWNVRKGELKLTQESAAHALGWNSQGAFNQYLHGKVPLNISTIFKMAALLRCEYHEITPDIMAFAQIEAPTQPTLPAVIEFNKKTASNNLMEVIPTYNVTETSDINYREIPFLTWVQAGDFCDNSSAFDEFSSDKQFFCHKKCSEQTYALQVQGPSMEPEYLDGDYIFVDPQREAIHNSDVIVRLENSHGATFKRLQIVGDRKYLIAINKNWPDPIIPVDEQAVICGVVIFSGKDR